MLRLRLRFHRGLVIAATGIHVLAGCQGRATGDGAQTESESDTSGQATGTASEMTTLSGPGTDGASSGSTNGDSAASSSVDTSGAATASATGGSTETTETGGTTGEMCGSGIDIPEDSSAAICPPDTSTTQRVVECICAYDPPLFDPALRPTDTTELLYYVNRWYSLDPCFPVAPAPAVLDAVRETYINAIGDLEPEMLTRCGDYDVELITVPAQFTDDADVLRLDAWTRPAPQTYLETLGGEPVGRAGQIGFGPMFAAAADAGIQLYVISGFRTLTTQDDLFAYYADLEGDPDLAAVYSAWPAHSEHQLGTTADVGYIEDGVMVSPFDPLEADLHQSEAFVWIRANAHRFGIVTTYQPQRVHVHQYKPEPWHVRFVGVEAADLMHACGLSTEELLAFRYGIEPLPQFIRMDLVYDAVLEGGWDARSCAE